MRPMKPMHIASVGGGPAGLYASILLKKACPEHRVTVYERNPSDRTFGFGVVFSDATLGNLRDADPDTYARIAAEFSHWDDIDVHYGGALRRSTGHGFSGLSRQKLLTILQDRAAGLGVDLRFGSAVEDFTAIDCDLLLACDGVNSRIRDALADQFEPSVVMQDNRFVWLGTTRRFPAFTFYFKEDDHGLWRVHAYNYDSDHSTFIVETTAAAWRSAGMDTATEAETRAYCERLFADELEGHPLLANHSIWRQFPTVSNARWSARLANGRPVVLMGDAVHTAHFSIGSGTKLAMEDAIDLTTALDTHDDVDAALAAYEGARRPVVASTQRAAEVSLAWFEETERYFGTLDPTTFSMSLLTRSLRINHANLRLRDPAFVEAADAEFARAAAAQADRPQADTPPPPPMFTPFKLRDLVLENRIVVSPMCQYSATDGVPDDWHMIHLGSRAMGGAGLVVTEATGVSPAGRITHGCTGIWSDAQQAAWARIVDAAHAHSGAAIALQLGHAGRKGSAALPWEGGGPLEAGAWTTRAPSALPFADGWPTPREMTAADIDAVIAEYVAAAERADAAGFDMLELHAAHGYLLASFLSPLTNQRTDEFGGELEGRMRCPLMVFEAIRATWPSAKPISVRLPGSDWVAGGWGPDDAVAFAAALRARGCDIVDVSSGQTTPDSAPRYGRLYQTPFADRVRQEAGIPTMTVGAISSYGDVNGILAAGRADLCVLARAHLFDPYWTRHAAFEQGYAMPWPNQYKALERFRPRFEWSARGNEQR